MAQLHDDLVDLLAARLNRDRAPLAEVLAILEDGGTVPFVARYRRERSGGMTEAEIREIRDAYTELCELNARRRTMLRSLRKRGKLTPELEEKIRRCTTREMLEDHFLPFRTRKAAAASAARSKGLEPFANELLDRSAAEDPEAVAQRAAATLGDGLTVEEALQGLAELIAEKVAVHPEVRAGVRALAREGGVIRAKVKPEKAGESSRFQNYYDFKEPVSRIPAHRMLALRRGEKEGFLEVDLEFDREKMLDILRSVFPVEDEGPRKAFLERVFADAGDRLIRPAVAAEVRAKAKRRADLESIAVFSENLREILLSPPAGACCVIGVEPGSRRSTRLAVVDASGALVDSAVVQLGEPESKLEEAKEILRGLVEKHAPKYVAVGNGSASRRTERTLRAVLKQAGLAVPVVVVNESGAGVYASSRAGREEFPNLDIPMRGALTIARRLQDPLAELVKVDPRSIGVGQYQYDVNQTLLRRRLHEVVESCVNHVGVDVNRASAALLSYVAGVGEELARELVAHRTAHGPFASRVRLMDVKGMGPRSFEQSAGFLRIRDSEIPLDRSAIHPESYYIVEKIAADLKKPVEELLGNPEALAGVDPNRYIDGRAGLPTVEHILEELAHPGRDPREPFREVKFRTDVTDLEHLEVGMVLEGRVSNVTRFGVFVDIGVRRDGLVHISELSDKFVRDPAQVMKVGSVVKVKVIDVDKERKRISLSIKALNQRPPRRRPAGRRGREEGRSSRAGRGGDAAASDRKVPRKGKKASQTKKPPPKEEKLRTVDDLLKRFGHPHKPRLE